MKKTRKIQDNDRLYNILRHYVDFVLKMSYRKIQYSGTENIPSDGAVIFAPNHTNALMDALVVLAMNRSPKVFVARADIFKVPVLAKIFRFLKIMPIMRMRDGINEVRKNNETIEKAVDVLKDKVPFCIFPEGQHQAKHSAQPLSKGIFRIAFQAQELMPDTPLYIVPVGVQYGNFFRFRSTVMVKVGQAINVGKFIAENSEISAQEQMNKMKDLLFQRMKSLIMYIPNDDDYEATYEVCAAAMRSQRKMLLKNSPKGKYSRKLAHFEANAITTTAIARAKAEDPQTAAQLMELGKEASRMRVAQNISLSSLTSRFPFWLRILRFLFFLVSLPYCIPASILTLPIYFICNVFFKLLKDHAFKNSARFLANLVIWPLLVMLYAIITFIFLPWEIALPVTVLVIPAPIIAQEMWRLFRLEISDIKYLLDGKLREKYAQIRKIVLDLK